MTALCSWCGRSRDRPKGKLCSRCRKRCDEGKGKPKGDAMFRRLPGHYGANQ